MQATATPPLHELNTPEMQRRINALRTIDNVTNWFYLVREWLFVLTVIALAVTFYECRAGWDVSWWWNLPVTCVAIALVGAGQHRLTNLTHEAAHYMLFRNRLLNDFVSDWCCMFPLFSTTHHYRIQHLAHHQFVNDPELDPDVAQLEMSGHRFRFPMAKALFIWTCVLKQILWVPGLIRYIRARAKFSATGGGSGPYVEKGPKSKIAVLVGIVYLLALVATVTGLAYVGDPWLLGLVPTGMWLVIMTFYAVIPERMYRRSLIRPAIPPRFMTLLRMTHMTVVFTGLAWLSVLTDRPCGLYFLLLWLVPIVTSFSFYMILRQVVQHGNADRDRLTNTRIFHVGWYIRFAVFPLGMDYHLPHHLFPMVPHFRLRQLHALLLEVEDYRKHATVVDGYFYHGEKPPTKPTVLELMERTR